MGAKRFSANILAAIREDKILGILAGTEPHRIIGIWAVVVERRVFVRSWSLKPRSWYRTFLEEPRGVIQVGKRKILIRAVQTRSERLKDAVSQAYRENTTLQDQSSLFGTRARAKSRNTTTELVPLN